MPTEPLPLTKQELEMYRSQLAAVERGDLGREESLAFRLSATIADLEAQVRALTEERDRWVAEAMRVDEEMVQSFVKKDEALREILSVPAGDVATRMVWAKNVGYDISADCWGDWGYETVINCLARAALEEGK
jgi:hypothetical protein